MTRKWFALFIQRLKPLRGLVPRWSFFSRVGNSKVLREMARWFVLVPILVRALATVTREVTEVPQLDVIAHFALPFDWQLLYYSAFSFMLAGIIYELRAPRLFRDFPNYFHFSQAKMEWRESVDYLLEVGKFGRGRSDSKTVVVEILRLGDDPREAIDRETRLSAIEDVDSALHSVVFTSQERQARRLIWRFINRCRLLARIFCCALYFIGFSFLAIAFFSDLHTVIEHSVKTHLLGHLEEMIELESSR